MKRILWLTPVIAVLGGAGLTYAALDAAGLDFNGNGSGASRGALLTENRDRLAICVQAVGVQPESGALMNAAARAGVEAALLEVEKHPGWVGNGFAEQPAVVNEGCGVEPALYESRDPGGQANSFFGVRGRSVSQPNYHRVLVFILPREEVARYSGPSGFRLTAEELACSGDTCDQVTTGVYLSEDELADTAWLADQLEKAVGLEAPF